MSKPLILSDPSAFSQALFELLTQLNTGIAELELYEFRYALDNLTPAEGWVAVQVKKIELLEQQINQPTFFKSIELKPIQDKRIVLDAHIVRLNQQLFTGMVSGEYPLDWVREHFYFDIRAFSFFVRTQYFTPQIIERFGGQPLIQFSPRQKELESLQDIGYPEFRQANREIDRAFLDLMLKLVGMNGAPLLLTIVGPSCAGKSEITARLQEALRSAGHDAVAVEMDNFFKDRSYRDNQPMDTQVIHFDLFKKAITDLLQGRAAAIPRYDFVLATSSHDLESSLRPGQTMLEIRPADIILLEGNFPFHIPEIAPLIDIKVIYLTDDPARLKRKWRRDVDYRKKYDPAYLCNRYFKTQRLRADEIYQPMLAVCDLAVDTTSAALWAATEIAAIIG